MPEWRRGCNPLPHYMCLAGRFPYRSPQPAHIYSSICLPFPSLPMATIPTYSTSARPYPSYHTVHHPLQNSMNEKIERITKLLCYRLHTKRCIYMGQNPWTMRWPQDPTHTLYTYTNLLGQNYITASIFLTLWLLKIIKNVHLLTNCLKTVYTKLYIRVMDLRF